jgi:hypothetical protein
MWRIFSISRSRGSAAHLEAHRRVGLVDAEQVRLRADEGHERHHEFLADRIDRRVGDLREQLLEVVVQRLVLVRQHGQRRVVAHRADAFLAVALPIGNQLELEVFLGVAEGLLAIEQGTGLGLGHRVGRVDVVELDADAARSSHGTAWRGELILEFLVVDDAALLEVDEEHLARLQTPLLDDLLLGIGSTPDSEAIITRSSSVTM